MSGTEPAILQSRSGSSSTRIPTAFVPTVYLNRVSNGLQTIVRSATAVKLQFPLTVQSDHSSITVTSNTDFTLAETGTYMISLQANTNDNTATTETWFQFADDDVSFNAHPAYLWTSSFGTSRNGSIILNITAGQTIYPYIYYGGGPATQTSPWVNGGPGSGWINRLMITRLA